MKKTFFIFMAIAFANVLLFTSCEKDKSDIVGTWVAVKVGGSRTVVPAVPANIIEDLSAVDEWHAKYATSLPLEVKDIPTGGAKQ